MIDSVGQSGIRGAQISSSLGYIYIPKEVDRNSFVETCMRKGVCSVVRENSFGVMNNVKIGVEEIQLIDWPKETGKLGSTVVLVIEPYRKTYSVVAVLNSRGEFLKSKEGVRIISKESENGRVTITLDSNSPTIQVMTEGGNVELIARGGEITLKSDQKIDLQCESITHNEADEPMLRGNKTTDLLEELINLLVQTKVATSIGLQPLNNFVQIDQLKQKLEDLKSTKSYLE